MIVYEGFTATFNFYAKISQFLDLGPLLGDEQGYIKVCMEKSSA